jgi:acetylornithine/succinyldiaminopimelate/putrescine aminotransferase
VALDVVRTIAEPQFLAEVRAKGEWFGQQLEGLTRRSTRVRQVRGRGLMWGIELAEPAAPIVAAARERKLLILTAGPTVIRIVPPLTITRDELARGVSILGEVLG